MLKKKLENLEALSEEQLDDVSGGTGNLAEYLPANHGPRKSQYEAQGHIGQKVYLVKDDNPKTYYWGTLVNSYEDKTLWGGTTRKHVLAVEGVSDYFATHRDWVTQTIYFTGKDFTVFLYN